ncbi:MAG: 3-oxoacyl-ACP synthase III [Thermoanaerobaculales bacterium]|jgi:3-oxoacyl-[acyl-carrier-protein] synthase-3|nr:3-oxoacyl-ACP synthase III [Thermoanaerobaculales bacterium]
MRFDNVQILSVAHIEAPHPVGSDEIEAELGATMSRLGIPPGMIERFSGIRSRLHFDEEMPPSAAATEAGERAIAAAGIDRDRLGVVVNTSVCRDFIEPSTASIVHSKLGLASTCLNFDISNACLAFINGMEMVSNMIERKQVEYGIVVNAENTRHATRRTIERLSRPDATWEAFRDAFATLTLGSGAVAMILGRARGAVGEHRFLGGVNLSATQHCRLCVAQVDSMVTNAKKLLNHGMELALKTWARAREALGWTPDNIDHFIIHQVGKAHTERFARTLGIDLAKIFRLYPDHGNIGPAGVPIVLSKLVEGNRLAAGDRIALMGIGSGINCTMSEVVW